MGTPCSCASTFDPHNHQLKLEFKLTDLPFVRPEKPLSESRLALVTTGGVHLPEQERFDIDDPHGDCSYREIPSDAYALTWTHAYYAPGRGTDLDSVFPLWTLRTPEVAGKLAEDGVDVVLLTPS